MSDKSVASELLAELARARAEFPPFHSAHEGYGVILEELDELWDVVKDKHDTLAHMREEAIQVGAMAIKFITDVIDKDEEID